MDKVTGFAIPVIDLARAKNFFKTAFGWKVDDWAEQHFRVKTVTTNRSWTPKEKGIASGTLYKAAGKREKPLLVITVSSIEEALEKVRKAKGEIITDKTEAGDWGWWAAIRDTEDNTFELWQDKIFQR